MNLIEAILADPSVGVDFQNALRRAEEGKSLRRAEYVAAMLQFDHQFEFSDDQRVWRAGRDELRRLRALRENLDPDGALWRANMHDNFKESM